MSHFSAEEFVDLLDDVLPPARRAHLAACASCRAEADALSGVVARAAEGRDVPEPSPLFWGHLSARISAGMTAPAAKTWKDLVWWPGSAWAAGVASVVLVLLVSQASFHAPSSGVLSRAPFGVSSHSAALVADPPDDLDDDQDWALVRSVADDSVADAAHDAGITTRPDAAERMTLELSSREKSELVQLLEGELKRTGT